MPDNMRVVLSPELRDDYFRVYRDPARLGSSEWYDAANTLFDAGLIQVEPDESDAIPRVDAAAIAPDR